MTDAATALAQKITALIDRGNLETSGQEHVDGVKAVVLLEAAADMLLELARDGERLDWLIREGWVYVEEGSDGKRRFYGQAAWVRAQGDDVRSHIDAARNATQEKPDETQA